MRPEPPRCPVEVMRAEGRFLKLFGVEIQLDGEEHREDSCPTAAARMTATEEEIMRKSRSMGNLTTCEVAGTKETVANAGDQGYLSDEGPDQSTRKKKGGRGQERKRGVPWSEEEHRTFLRGLEKLGKGDWRGIAKNFVTTRTPTQVASHAQKYFLRQTNPNKKKRRSSLFDVVMNDNASVSSKASSLSLNESNVNVVPEVDNLQKDLEVEAQVVSSTNEVSGTRSLECHPSVPSMTNRPDVSELRNKTSLTTGAPGAKKNLAADVECRNSQTLSHNPMVKEPYFVAGKVFNYTLNSAATCPPDFFMLSVRENPHLQPLFPDHAATTPVPQINDLELRIGTAPPQPHVLTKLSSPNASGAIRVV